MKLIVTIQGEQYELSEWKVNNGFFIKRNPPDFIGRTVLNTANYQYSDLPFVNDEIGFYLDLTKSGYYNPGYIYRFGGSGIVAYISDTFNKVHGDIFFKYSDLELARQSVDDFIIHKLPKLSAFI